MADTERPAYHHGDLRVALVQSALDLIDEQGVEALSLREVARRAGVSRAAPYHHFDNKEAMTAAVAQHGFVQLTMRMQRIPDDQPALDALRQCVEAHLSFAVHHRTLYRLMFSTKLGAPRDHPELKAEAEAAFLALQERLSRLQAVGGAPAGTRHPWAMAVWAAVHGMASLMIDDADPLDPAVHDAWRDALLGLIEGGLAHAASAAAERPVS